MERGNYANSSEDKSPMLRGVLVISRTIGGLTRDLWAISEESISGRGVVHAGMKWTAGSATHRCAIGSAGMDRTAEVTRTQRPDHLLAMLRNRRSNPISMSCSIEGSDKRHGAIRSIS